MMSSLSAEPSRANGRELPDRKNTKNGPSLIERPRRWGTEVLRWIRDNGERCWESTVRRREKHIDGTGESPLCVWYDLGESTALSRGHLALCIGSSGPREIALPPCSIHIDGFAGLK